MGRIGLAFLVGHCCIHGLPRLPDASYVVVLLIAATLAAALRSRVLVALACGIAWAWGNAAARIADDLPTVLEGRDVLVQGCVQSMPETDQSTVRFVFEVNRAEAGVPKRLQLAWYEAPLAPAVGETWQLVVRLKRRNGFSNPGGFDYEAHLFRAGLGATGYVRGDDRNRRLAPPSMRHVVTQLRAWISARMGDAVENRSMLGVLQGLAIGDTREMTGDQWKVFSTTGTTHLMAISGLHITMVATLAAGLGGMVVRWRDAQQRGWTAARGRIVAGALGALGYSVLAGLSVPTQRTLMMLCVYFVARWSRRELSVVHSLGLAVIGVLLIDPFAPLSVGAWLSFGAVATILLAVSGRLGRDSVFSGFTRVQLAITVGLLPLLLASFGSLSIVSPIANAVAVPLFTLLVVPLVLVGAAGASIAPAIGAAPLELATMLLQLLWTPLKWLADQPMALWHLPSLPTLSLVALSLGAAFLVLPGIWPTRLLGVLLCTQAFVIPAPKPRVGDFNLTILDVGQGLAIMVRTREHVLIYDTGPAFQSGRNAADLAVLPYLRSKGIRHIDVLMVSHGDLDHRGGAPSLLAELATERVFVGPSVDIDVAQPVPCARGQQWSWEGVRFEVLHPPADYISDDNDTSCVLYIEGRGGSALLTGDIEALGEQELLEGALAKVDVVVVPHHGSRTSSTSEFVAALSPGLAVFSAGYRNRWGLPKLEVVQRWQRAGARAVTTAGSGAIEVSFTETGALHVREHRRASRRYWSRSASDD